MIKLKYVQRYRDRTGKLRHYLRRKGRPKLPLPGLPGSREFMTAYQAAINAKPVPKDLHAPGTMARLILDFYRGPQFLNLKPSSQRTYRSILDLVMSEHGHRFVCDMRPRDARKIVEEVGTTRPAMANLTRKVLHRLMEYAIKIELRDNNPVTGIDGYKGGTRHTWTEEELNAYEARWPLGTRQRLAYDALLYTGQRRGDVVRLLRPKSADARIHVIQEKTGAELLIPVHQCLWESLKAYSAKGIMLVGNASTGRPITGPALTLMVHRAAREAGLPERCKAHGLRKALSRRLAEQGATGKEIAAAAISR